MQTMQNAAALQMNNVIATRVTTGTAISHAGVTTIIDDSPVNPFIVLLLTTVYSILCAASLIAQASSPYPVL